MDLLDAALKNLRKDYGVIKGRLYQIHNITVQRYPTHHKRSYKIRTNQKTEVIEFSSEQLKEMTKHTMKEYFFGERSKTFNETERVWKVPRMEPPTSDLD